MPSVQGKPVPGSFVEALKQSFITHTRKANANGEVRNLDETDSKSVWFPYEQLEKLFTDNGLNADNKKSYGLRIYFGIHNQEHALHKVSGYELPQGYNGQHTAALVATITDVAGNTTELLKDGSDLSTFTNNALDFSGVCPPDCK